NGGAATTTPSFVQLAHCLASLSRIARKPHHRSPVAAELDIAGKRRFWLREVLISGDDFGCFKLRSWARWVHIVARIVK
ncbi:hypothetical protein PanWU01x14_095510, partial [Parasponia andersonii]